jgi:hypothetical protein
MRDLSLPGGRRVRVAGGRWCTGLRCSRLGEIEILVEVWGSGGCGLPCGSALGGKCRS